MIIIQYIYFVVSAIPPHVRYLGCFPPFALIEEQLHSMIPNSPAFCMQRCFSQGFTYASLFVRTASYNKSHQQLNTLSSEKVTE